MSAVIPETESELVLVHTSDLHLGTHGDRDDLDALRDVLAAARHVSADVVLLSGDIFDTNRVKLSVLDRVTRTLADAGRAIVILPGNHDPATADSAYRRGGLADPENVHVLGVTCDERAVLPDLNLEVCGRPHVDYVDMAPLASPAERQARHQVIMAHGHFVRGGYDLHRSWLLHEHDLGASSADYIALGHWELAQRVGPVSVEAHYSGSPHRAGSVNVVRLDGAAPAVSRFSVRREDLERVERGGA